MVLVLVLGGRLGCLLVVRLLRTRCGHGTVTERSTLKEKANKAFPEEQEV